MAAADFFDIRIQGQGAHGAYPHNSADPVMTALALGGSLQSIVEPRNINPIDPAVVSIRRSMPGRLVQRDSGHGPSGRNSANLGRAGPGSRGKEDPGDFGWDRGRLSFNDRCRDPRGVQRAPEQPREGRGSGGSAAELFGEAALNRETTPRMGSEDFADMLHTVPGAYCWLGMASGPALHNPNYRFDDEVIPLGASLLARIVERQAA